MKHTAKVTLLAAFALLILQALHRFYWQHLPHPATTTGEMILVICILCGYFIAEGRPGSPSYHAFTAGAVLGLIDSTLGYVVCCLALTLNFPSHLPVRIGTITLDMLIYGLLALCGLFVYRIFNRFMTPRQPGF